MPKPTIFKKAYHTLGYHCGYCYRKYRPDQQRGGKGTPEGGQDIRAAGRARIREPRQRGGR